MAGGYVIIQVRERYIRYLEKRGAAPHRGQSQFSRSVVFGRMLETLQAYQSLTDPRHGGKLPEAVHRMLIAFLPAPWELRLAKIESMERWLERTPGFEDAARSAGLSSAEVVAAVAALSAPEKLTLVDHAVQAQAPAAAAQSRKRP